jgi:hypothetical protein
MQAKVARTADRDAISIVIPDHGIPALLTILLKSLV